MKLSVIPNRLVDIAFLLVLPCVNAQASLPALNGSSTCGAECQELVPLAIAYEHSAHAHYPLDDFYSIPSNFTPSMEPGTLLSVETHTNLTNYTVPSSLTMSRIMYTSMSLNGTIVPASAFVLWPYAPFEYNVGKTSKTASGKFPMVAWAHGTAGLFAACAPSNYRSLQYQFMTSYSLAIEGFAVVATDYAGLGVTTLPNGEQSHAYLAGAAGANDVAYAVEATRKAFPAQFEPEGPFVTMGHSQGGNVAWAFAERQAHTKVSGYLGTITISPPMRVIDELNAALQTIATTTIPIASLPLWVTTIIGLQPIIIAGITAVFPSYNYSGMSPIAYDRYQNVVKPLQGCLPTNSLAYADVTDFAIPGWTNDSIVQQWQDQYHVSGREFQGPLLIIAGSNDVISIDQLSSGINASCDASCDQSLEAYVYNDMEHFPVIQASRIKWMSWIKDKFTGNSKSDGSCGKMTTVQGFNTNYTIQSQAANWLVGWTNSSLGWEESL
ncbi:uncharacterized protein LY89DRAFT_765845 [Mollisia scopiformis]|uniref:AB hydrolase-1 domain-containing protein n=1 Tax=Mollisia scopiformis TaxID=149040 RepID=A0A132B625_MOLSC|nr:uncharacterized protein LY89DRAFT_765845 [Mollisia scopiformis]KUJ07791.1 hypothetical protein LY89DRAFT_765845 [Mollisia scopiformis]